MRILKIYSLLYFLIGAYFLWKTNYFEIVRVLFWASIEEFIFRYYLFNYFDRKLGFWYAAIISSLVFMSIHYYLPIEKLPSALLFGFYMCLMYDYMKNIIYLIVVHAASNMMINAKITDIEFFSMRYLDLPGLGFIGLTAILFKLIPFLILFLRKLKIIYFKK